MKGSNKADRKLETEKEAVRKVFERYRNYSDEDLKCLEVALIANEKSKTATGLMVGIFASLILGFLTLSIGKMFEDIAGVYFLLGIIVIYSVAIIVIGVLFLLVRLDLKFASVQTEVIKRIIEEKKTS
ncbi:hypothetical protein GE107_07050 [Cohnella sp. CFH 77786]|uniref:hypothetical protein n=1 Tax=Cohnella sp. CFH 77786 TaxID=2662265 RepID=UPI001C60C85A|nr:hypothetical protein [Cohnella sp. CFH 77786]MBW5445817.1 hypothetical protein [Cohnella sp. CFH 77786]